MGVERSQVKSAMLTSNPDSAEDPELIPADDKQRVGSKAQSQPCFQPTASPPSLHGPWGISLGLGLPQPLMHTLFALYNYLTPKRLNGTMDGFE